MELGRCRRLVPLVVLAAVGAATVSGPPLLAARSAAWTPPHCPDGGAPPGSTVGTDAWYRMDPSLDRTGTLAAMRLVVGAAGAVTRTIELAPESFASGPVGGRVVAGSDDGTRTQLVAIDPARGCQTVLGREHGAVVRSAIASADGTSLYEHRVDRVTRADLGVWRRPLEGWQADGPARRVLEPLPVDDRYGPVFTTDLRLAVDGTLVVSSCGVRLCRVRVRDAMGHVTMTGPTGPALGVSDGRLVTWAACAGMPCAVVAHEPDGTQQVLADRALSAALGGRRSGVLVVDAGDRLTAVDVHDGRVARLRIRDGSPVGGGSIATSGAASSPEEVVLAPHGRAGEPAHINRLVPAVPGALP